MNGERPQVDFLSGCRLFFRSPAGLMGALVVLLHLVIALSAPVLTPNDPKALNPDAVLHRPSPEHFLGTDKLGRDVFARTLQGGRLGMFVATVGMATALAWGGLLGIGLAVYGGWIDELVMRVVDAFLALPQLLFLLLFVSLLGTNTWVLVGSLGFLYGIPAIRISRAAALNIVTSDFVLAARARGERRWWIMRAELLPNIFDILLVEGVMRWSWMFMTFSSLSFLGFGAAPPTPDWGIMVANNSDVMGIAPWTVFFPILAISSLVLGANLAADALAKVVKLDRVQEITT